MMELVNKMNNAEMLSEKGGGVGNSQSIINGALRQSYNSASGGGASRSLSSSGMLTVKLGSGADITPKIPINLSMNQITVQVTSH
jgi:hypothetical protein